MRRSITALRQASRASPRVAGSQRSVSTISLSRGSTGIHLLQTGWAGLRDGGMGGMMAGERGRAFSVLGAREDKYRKPFLLADIGEGITECEIVKWMVEPDQVIEEFDPIVEVMSDKATVEITSPYAGRIKNLAGNIGDIVKVGGVLCEVEMENEAQDSEIITSPSPPAEVYIDDVAATTSSTSTGLAQGNEGVVGEMMGEGKERKLVHATPATRRLAKEEAIDLRDVDGTGRDGRVTKSDVMNYVANGKSNSNKVSAPTPSSTPSIAPTTTATAIDSTEALPPIALSPLRKAMFRAMTSTLQIPHFAYSETIDVTLLERLRLTLNANIPLRYRHNLTAAQETELAKLVEWGGEGRVAPEERYERMTMLPLMIKAMSNSMATNRLFLSSLASSTTPSEEPKFLPRRSHDISLALSAPAGGLFTPLLTSVDKSSPYKIASQIAHLQQISLASSPPKFPHQYKGTGTITLSNVGVVGGRTTHPIIPPTGQLAIGALGRMRIVPTYARSSLAAAKALAISGGEEEGELEGLKVLPRLMLDVTFCADHRVVEGVELARLVEEWKRILEDPSRLVGI